MSSLFCQNKTCCHRKNQNQMRGSKGYKVYQSYKASPYYYDMFCGRTCFQAYFTQNLQVIQNAIPIIDKQTIGVEDYWEFGADYNYDCGDRNYNYFLLNKLMGTKHNITKEQAQTPEQFRNNSSGWSHRPDSEAKPLAQSLGLIQNVA